MALSAILELMMALLAMDRSMESADFLMEMVESELVMVDIPCAISIKMVSPLPPIVTPFPPVMKSLPCFPLMLNTAPVAS